MGYYKMEFQGQSEKVRSSCLSSFHPNHIVFRLKTAKKMKIIRERLDQIAEERIKFHLTETVTERRTGVIDWRQTTSVITQPQIYGREEDRDTILDFLVVDAFGFEDLSVYPIVGLGGLGKTTIAQLIFNHERVVNHFELRIWVCVYEDFSLKRMIKAIVESASGHPCADMDLEPLQRRLQDLLQQKRYLLVLDDVWDDEQENWQRLKSVLACGAKGASILVTTRLPKVAAIMGTVPPHELSLLSDNDCWELFKQRAFGPNEAEREGLLVLGKEIVKKCGGVPFAAKALGGLLRFKRKENEWLYVKESQLWSLQDEGSVMPALRLSYLNLPVKLRQCFAFCALFPKDVEIEKQFLIELWMANGFVSSNETLNAEDIGDEVWNELYWRSFFQDIQTDIFGKIKIFKMHDLVHDLAQSVTEEVCCITYDNNNVKSTSERIRHLSTYRRKSFWLHKLKALKTYIERYNYVDDQLPSQVLKCYSLRVLQSTGLSNLSASIGHLKHLRYLDISMGRFETLPESLCRIWNLQILKLDCCYDLKKLPNSLIQLKALQHLSLMDCFSLTSLPPQIGKLTSLRTLSMYFVSKEKGFLLAELGRLNLKGVLHIKNLERVKSVMDAKDANMSSKQLNTLLLSWGRNEESEVQENVEQILEVLQPHTQQLQNLGVGGYPGARFPQWMSSPSLEYLNALRLVDCKSCLQLPLLGKLPSLKELCISNMSNVIYLQEKSYDGGVAISFMALEFLLLKELPNLIRLSSEDGENMFPRLSKLEITQCPKLLGLPCLPSLNELRIIGECNQDILSSIHKLGSLESLYFYKNEELTCFPDGMLQNLTSLKILDISWHSRLEVLPTEMANLNALQELYIKGCDNLQSLTDEVLQGLHSLKILEIVGFPKFKLSVGIQYLTCLEELTIEGSSEVEDLHEALQHMTVLQTLALCDLPNLGSLPDCLGNLGLLHKLSISGCPKLKCLPMSIQRLSYLKTLEIWGCPELGNRCQKETGEDWPKIAHLQHIQIKNDVILRSGGWFSIGIISELCEI
ncbi:putative disease resistance protein RGA1 [Gastrolobium bilobum]|uniref:putative disease resistance protein RGA1 n=1 Tax=Gastrolobium bilobum TaxID=150636 RepID=UPI002AAF599A|nr:putative disease resistance protein RGA1 [Gastrolobium bilobum]